MKQGLIKIGQNQIELEIY